MSDQKPKYESFGCAWGPKFGTSGKEYMSVIVKVKELNVELKLGLMKNTYKKTANQPDWYVAKDIKIDKLNP